MPQDHNRNLVFLVIRYVTKNTLDLLYRKFFVKFPEIQILHCSMIDSCEIVRPAQFPGP